MTITCEVCGSKEAKRKAKIEKAVLMVCDDCVKLGEEIPILVKREVKKEKKTVRNKPKSKITIGDIVEVG